MISPVGAGHPETWHSQTRFVNVRISSMMMGQRIVPLKTDSQVASCLFRSPFFGSKNKFSVQYSSSFRSVNPVIPSVISSFVPSGTSGSSFFGSALRSTFCIYPPRPRAVNKAEAFCGKGTENDSGSGKYGSNKHEVRVTALPDCNGSSSRVTSINGVKNINLCEARIKEVKVKPQEFPPITDGPGSSNGSKQNRQPRSKKKNEVLSSTLGSGSLKGSRRARNVKSEENDSSIQVSETSKSCCIGGTDEVVHDALSSANSKSPSTKKTTRSKKKKASAEAAVAETNGALLKVGTNFLDTGDECQEHTHDKTGTTKKQAGKSFKPLYPPSGGKTVVVVESVTKAKVIQGYLGDMYEVIPSYGHVRDLAARYGSVRPNEDFSMVWEVPSSAWAHIKNIKAAIRRADNLVLASDPDREGEAIAWHVIEMLQQQDALREDLTVVRVVFQEITDQAIKHALQSPRDIDDNLVHAYLARRALDYLIGFNISPLLWRKLPACQSAGRVQSAALALICDRETEIDKFKPQEYWTVEAVFRPQNSESSEGKYWIPAHLTVFDSKKLKQLSVSSEAEAKNIEQVVTSSHFKVISSKISKIKKNPPTPYITSTLQQDAANKLNFSATYTMKLAQKLYEGIHLSNGNATGLITYMRTDGLHISDGAAHEMRDFVLERYGEPFASASPRKFFKKVKNAQEAHEAIRPTDIRRLPSKLVDVLDEDSLQLYALIWSRTVACQMEPAMISQVQVYIGNDQESIVFRASCSGVEFPGYRAVYEDVESKDIRGNDSMKDHRDKSFLFLKELIGGVPLHLIKVEPKQHYTQAPPRYSEASLVRNLEELGIGRPSTYATTIKVLQDRKYITVKSRVLYPEFRGRMVSAFLMHYFSEIMDYSFTADMETELDNVSSGTTEWKGLLSDYWKRFKSYCDNTSKVHIHQVEKMLERTFEDFLFSSLPDQRRTCPSCSEGTLIFKVSKFGAGYFIGCDQHPSCKYIAKTLYQDDEDGAEESSSVEEPKLLGLHAMSQEKVFLKKGPYGLYVQLGEDRKGSNPKRSSVPQFTDVNSLTLDDAVELLRYPLTLGYHPEDGQPVVLKLTKVGYTIGYRRHFAPVPKNTAPSEITMEKALELLAGKSVRRRGRPKKKPQEADDDKEKDEVALKVV